jgi:quercetin dioxygenase-like cupin family protein
MNKMLVFVFSLLPLLLLLFLPSGSADAQIAKEKPLLTKVLPDISGEEGLIETVVLSPGEVVPAHRHNADVFAYVLEGSIVTQLEGHKSQIVHAGEAFYESPEDVHIVTRNASATRPARLLVFFVKKIGAPATVAVTTLNTAR